MLVENRHWDFAGESYGLKHSIWQLKWWHVRRVILHPKSSLLAHVYSQHDLDALGLQPLEYASTRLLAFLNPLVTRLLRRFLVDFQ